MRDVDQNQSGGANLESGRDTTVGGDVVGRDKIESAGGNIIHTGPNSTIIIGPQTSPAPGELTLNDPHYFDEAVQKYRQRMRELYSFTRMLGKPEPVPLEGMFTDVYLLDRPTAMQRFDIEVLKAEQVERGSFWNDSKRVDALQLASQKSYLFILGKPGAGKTTFLKYLTLRTATADLKRVPIFISLNDWASSGSELLPFIQRQFEICAFPDAQPFIRHLLQRGEALVCFDGLDEVNEAGDTRSAIIQAIRDFITQYPYNQHLITCRIAATDYTFEKFTYVEMADFAPEQVQVFVRKWFAPDEDKAQCFIDELHRGEHRGLRELAQTPLLLTLLCLAFEENLTFPARRVDLYEDALNVLLKKWDASRNLKRDEVYRGLSLGRKRRLFTQLAAEYFEQGEIFFRQNDLTQRVGVFLKNLLGSAAADEPDGEAVLQAVEAQHGIFVERAHRVYSFSHLTLQEYFVARYIVDHAVDGALERLIKQHLTDDRWREVFLLTASMLPPEAADIFFVSFQNALDDVLRDERLLAYSRWAAEKADDYAYLGHPAVARVTAWATATMTSALALDSARDRALARALALDLALDRDHARALARTFARTLDHDRDRDLPDAPALNFAPNFALDRDLPHALALDRALDRDLPHALALDRALVRIHAHSLDRALARARALAHARALTRDLDSDLALDRAHALDRALYRSLDLARALASAGALAHALDRAHPFTTDLHRSLDLARAIDLDLDRSLDLDLDLALIFTWLIARLEYHEGVRQLLVALAHASRRAGQTEIAQTLNDLSLPTEETAAAWQAFAHNFQAFLIRYRNIGHDWNFTDEQQERIVQYERGAILLAECLKLAAVSDRNAIENRLLLPPEG